MSFALIYSGEVGLVLGTRLYVDMCGDLTDPIYLKNQCDLLYDNVLKVIGQPIMRGKKLPTSSSTSTSLPAAPDHAAELKMRAEAEEAQRKEQEICKNDTLFTGVVFIGYSLF